MKDFNPEVGRDEIQKMLERDAARIQEVAFNAPLHFSTLRRLRDESTKPSRPWLLPLATVTASLVIVATLVALWRPLPAPNPQSHTLLLASTPYPAPRCSLLAYESAAARSEEAFFDLILEDGRTLLPKSASAFSDLAD